MDEWEKNLSTEMPSDWALKIAARCWCDKGIRFEQSLLWLVSPPQRSKGV